MQQTLVQVLDGHHPLHGHVKSMLVYVQSILYAARLCLDHNAIVVLPFISRMTFTGYVLLFIIAV